MHSGYALYVTGGDARWWRGEGPLGGLGFRCQGQIVWLRVQRGHGLTLKVLSKMCSLIRSTVSSVYETVALLVGQKTSNVGYLGDRGTFRASESMQWYVPW